MQQNQKINKTQACPECFRPKDQCICGKVEAFSTGTHVLILQHPQEKLKLWNSARLANMSLPNSQLKIGLSWPNLRKASGLETDPSGWAVLFLKGKQPLEKPFQVFNKKEEPLLAAPKLEGIIVLDGSWKQASSTWWRNPWLLRLNRAALNSKHISGRNQAKVAGLATIESIAHTLGYLGEDPKITQGLLKQYQEFIVGPNRTGRIGRTGPTGQPWERPTPTQNHSESA